MIPAVLIVAAGLFGCRPEERRLMAIIATGTTLAFFPCLAIAMSSGQFIARGFVYALMVVAAIHWAMVVGRRRGGRSGGDGSDRAQSPQPEGPGPVDWPDFERRFWDEVGSGPHCRPPAGTEPRERAPA